MRKILFIIFIFISLNGNAQNNTNKVYYNAPKIDLLLKTGDELDTYPWGINVLITYDKYFKSLSISFTDEQNKKNIFEFYFVKILDDPNDNEEPFIKMRTKNNEIVFVTDRLQINGSLMINQDDKKSVFVIENAKKITKK